MKKIKFLATGDIHSDEKLIQNIKKYTNIDEIDFVILIGDISEKKNDFSKLLSIFENKDIFMVPGNHEDSETLKILKEQYSVHVIGNNPVMIEESLAIFGTNYIPIGIYGESDDFILDNLVQNYEAIKDAKFKIHLSHLPPSQTEISKKSPFFPYIRGCDAQLEFLKNFKPDFTLVGHIHESSGLEEIVNKTRVINVGKTFKVFELDTEKETLKLLKTTN